MTSILVRKLLRDVRVALLVVCLLLAAFQCLWVKIVDQLSGHLLPMLVWLGQGRNVSGADIEEFIFQGPGRILQTLIGGGNISLFRPTDMVTVGYVHPLVQTILCVWAIGRAAGAIAGEIDRGTMELLLAQPLARYRVVLAHLTVDFLTIPVLCLSLWAGNWLGAWLVGVLQLDAPLNSSAKLAVDPRIFAPALASVAALLFAISGYTMWLSACGRFRGRVLALAVLATLLQFLINAVGQLWETIDFLRPWTVFYYYQPQSAILNRSSPQQDLSQVVTLLAVGGVGYALAFWTFCRRDLPAPL
jgi:ABC-2 type transport system permease protein